MEPPSPALAISLIALAVALGGTGYAVTQLPKNSVGTAQIKNNAVTGAKVKDGSLLARDFKRGQLPAGAQGATGAQGPAGPQGAAGPQGEPGPTFAFSDSQVLASPIEILGGTTVVSHTVAMPRAGTLTGTVTGRVFAPSGAAGDSALAYCRVWMAPANVAISQLIPTSTVTSDGGNSIDGLMSLAFAYAVPAAGTYTLTVRCSRDQLGTTTTIGLDRYDLNGVLAGS